MTTPPDDAPPRDHATVARIRDAALHEFAERGVAGATMRSIAEAAGVSAQLVVHHFGSKKGVALACDRYVVAMFREHNMSLLSAGASFSPKKALEEPWLGPAMAYLAARLVDDSPAVAQLVDDAVGDATAYLEQGEESGLVKPSAYPRERVVVMMLWNLGAVALHRHAKRLLGVDLVAADPGELATWSRAATEMLTGGLFHGDALEKLRAETTDEGGSDE